MTFMKPFENKEFDTRFTSLKTRTSEYLTAKNYDLKGLNIDELIWWRDIGTKKIIEITEKCPNEIRGIITGFIKEEFPIESEK
jgi:hypothetical protein